MERLLESKLIYGRLMEISEPHLIERYNRAMAAFGLPPTQLEAFDIDMTGFSPQVATELGDRDYLDPNRINRRFIILSPFQEGLPVIHTSFSNTASLMHQFFRANRRAINAVTIRDALYGEIEEHVSHVREIEDLLSINEVTFHVQAADGTLAKSEELRELADRLLSSPNAWRNDAMIERMVELVRHTGDIRQNDLVPDKLVFRQDAYWTSHFGGLFVFADDRDLTVICDPAAPGFRRSRPWQVSYLPLEDHERIYRFLERTGRIETPDPGWLKTSGFLDHRIEMALWALVNRTQPDIDLSGADGQWLHNWGLRHADLVARDSEISFLRDVSRRLEFGGNIEIGDMPASLRFLLVRADPSHPDRWLTNQLISVMASSDFVSRFIFDKPGFYDLYEDYSDGFRAHVVATLTRTYLQDKRAFRQRLYGLDED